MAAIFYESSLSEVPVAEGIPDTFLHAAGYALLALVTLRATARARWSGVTLKAVVLEWAITTAYGASDEWHQSFTPWRSPELRDIRNDAIGALVAVGAAGAWGIMKRKSHVL